MHDAVPCLDKRVEAEKNEGVVYITLPRRFRTPPGEYFLKVRILEYAGGIR